MVSPNPPMPPVTSASRLAMTPPSMFVAGCLYVDYRTKPAANPALRHVQASVDRDVRPGDVARLVRREVGDQAGDLLGLGETSHRALLDDRLQNIGLDRLDHIGLDIARGNGIHGYALLDNLLSEGLGETVHARLRRRIVGLPELPFERVDRGDIDDTAPPALDHALDHLAGHIEDAVEIGVDHVVPVPGGHAL